MLTNRQEDLLGKSIGFTGFAVSILIFNGIAYDPVNLPKLSALTVLAGVVFGIYSIRVRNIWREEKNIFKIFLLFLIGIFVSTLASKNPIESNFYGGPGRNTGALSYLSLALIALGAIQIRKLKSFKLILFFLLISGYVNIIYCTFVLLTNKDPFPWTNPYGTFLGTFGNPNFISSFLGIFTSVSIMYVYQSQLRKWVCFAIYLTYPLSVYLIVETNSIQGLVVVGIGTILFIFRIVRERFGAAVQISVGTIAAIIGAISVLGMLQIGPFSNFLYKTSVSLRGEYWNAGWNMFKASPFWGIGLDSYGTFFREYRRPSAIVLPGADVVTDSAHNVFIDILASGGLLLFVPYILLQISVLVLSLSYIRKNKKVDHVFSALFVGWVTYLAQSMISINQLGLAIWGWIFPGAIIGYLRSVNSQDLTSEKSSPKRKESTQELTPLNFLTLSASTLVFSLAIAPYVITENAWKNSIRKDSAEQIIAAADKWPRSNSRFVQTIGLFLRSDMPEEALRTAQNVVRFNKNSFEGWFYIYNISVDRKVKNEALENLKQLDPLNPTYKS